MSPPRFESIREFWPFYLAQHSRSGTRAMHVIGFLSALGIVIVAGTQGWPHLGWLVLPVAYGFSWSGHFFIEGNKPASFGYPGWSFLSDFRMVGLVLSFRMKRELERHGITPKPSPSLDPATGSGTKHF